MKFCINEYIEKDVYLSISKTADEITQGLKVLLTPMSGVKYFSTYIEYESGRFFELTHKVDITPIGRHVEPTILEEITENEFLDKLNEYKTKGVVLPARVKTAC